MTLRRTSLRWRILEYKMIPLNRNHSSISMLVQAEDTQSIEAGRISVQSPSLKKFEEIPCTLYTTVCTIQSKPVERERESEPIICVQCDCSALYTCSTQLDYVTPFACNVSCNTMKEF